MYVKKLFGTLNKMQFLKIKHYILKAILMHKNIVKLYYLWVLNWKSKVPGFPVPEAYPGTGFFVYFPRDPGIPEPNTIDEKLTQWLKLENKSNLLRHDEILFWGTFPWVIADFFTFKFFQQIGFFFSV